MKLEDFLLGCAIGDSFFEYNKKDETLKCIGFSHNIKDLDYLKFKYDYLKKYSKIFRLSELKNIRGGNMYRFRLYPKNEEGYNIIYKIYELTRIGKIRILPNPNLINKDVITIWYLDDGYITARKITNKSGKSKYIRSEIGIGVKSYDDNKIIELSRYLLDEFNLETSFKKEDGVIRNILFSKNNSKYKFLDLIYTNKSLIPDCMDRKLCLCELDKDKVDSFKEYNMCDVYNTGICECRDDKDFRDCLL